MQTLEVNELHHPSGRRAAVVRVENFETPLSVDAKPYVLVIASERAPVPIGTKLARAWIDAGASYMCAWGPDSEAVEETFDYAGFLPECGGELPFTLMTTMHRDEPLEEALWFAFNCAEWGDLEPELKVVVIVVDSEALETRCRYWLETNEE